MAAATPVPVSNATQSVSIALILPVRDRKQLTVAILHQLTEQIADQPGIQEHFHIIVVDDNSSDGTPELIRQTFPQVHLLSGDGDLWWTGAISTGMDYAAKQLNTNYLVWLNDDIVVADDFIAQLVGQCQHTATNHKVITGGIVCAASHPDWIVFGGVIASQQVNDIHQFDGHPILKVDTLNGNITVMPTQIVDDIGLPDIKRFRHYGGDYEYICRAKEEGYQVKLSSRLWATTDYGAADVIRYMPLWIQWYCSSTWPEKRKILSSLKNRKSPFNAEHMVNSIHRNQPRVPRWKYTLFYCKKNVKILGSELVPAPMKRARIQYYFRQNNIPKEIVDTILK